MWVTHSAGCSLIVLQNQWNNEVQFCSVKFWHLPAQGAHPEQEQTPGEGMAAPLPRPLPSFPVQTRWAVTGPGHPNIFPLGAQHSGDLSGKAMANKSAVNQKERKVKRYLGGRICLPAPVKWESKAKMKGTGITLPRHRF